MPGLKGTAGVCLLAHRSANGRRVTTSYGARHALAFSGRQVPVFLGAGVPAQATWGEMPKAWNPDLRLTDLSGSDSHNPDPVLGWVTVTSMKGVGAGYGFPIKGSVRAEAAEASSVVADVAGKCADAKMVDAELPKMGSMHASSAEAGSDDTIDAGETRWVRCRRQELVSPVSGKLPYVSECKQNASTFLWKTIRMHPYVFKIILMLLSCL